MSRIFASEDIATLVANFSPLSRHQERPLLLPSHRDDTLVSIEFAVRRLEALLEHSQSRIVKSSLAKLLDVEQGKEDIVLHRLASRLYESASGDAFIPDPEIESIFEEFWKKASHACLDLESFTAARTIKTRDFERYLDTSNTQTLHSFCDLDNHYVYGERAVRDIQSHVRGAIAAAGREICKIPLEDLVSRYPLCVVHKIAEEFAGEIGGNVRCEEDDLIYMPAGYSESTDAKTEQKRIMRIRDLVQELADNGFCVLASDSKESDISTEDVISEYHKICDGRGGGVQVIDTSAAKNSSATKIIRSDPCQLIVLDTISAIELGYLQSTIRNEVDKLWDSDDRAANIKALTQGIQRNEPTMDVRSPLSEFLLRSAHAKGLLAIISERSDHLMQDENERFAQLLEGRLLVPFKLHELGVDTIQDATLKQHLEDFVLEHFRSDAVSQTIKAAREQHLLRDTTREKQVSKLRQALQEGKSLSALRLAMDRFCKKMHIESPSNEAVTKGKHRILQATVKSMKQMKRSSDILQNVVWVLLACSSPGLFMSSGKDTSRMIKQYEAVSDAESAKKLIQWRDLVKAGEENADELQAMCDLATNAVHNMTIEPNS